MKYLAALLVAALAACSSSPAQMPDGGVPDAAVPDASAPTADPTFSTLYTDRDNVIIGSAPVEVYVLLRDAQNAPISGAHVQLAVTSGSVTPPPATDIAGQTRATWMNTVTGTYNVTLIVDGVTFATHTVEFTPGSAAGLAFDQQPASIVAGEMMSPQVSVVTVDAFGNRTFGVSGQVELSLEPNASWAVLTGNTVWALMSGEATFPELTVMTPGTGYRIRAHLANLTDAVSDPFDVMLGDADTMRSTISATPTSLQADGVEATTIALHLANAYGTPITGAAVSLSVTGSNNVISATSGTTDATGDFTATISSTTPEAKTVTAMLGGLTLTTTLHFFGPSCTPLLPGLPGVKVPVPAEQLVVGDFDGDGHADALVLENGATLVLYRGRGDATFEAPTTLPSLLAPIEDVRAADINGDGHLDVVIVYRNGALVAFELGTGGGQFATPTYASVQSGSTRRVAVGDLDNDGNADLVVATDAATVEIERGTGAGTFARTQVIANLDVVDVGTVDLDNDGKLDVLLAGAAGVKTLLGHGDGTFAAPLTVAGAGAGNLVVADFNNDGNPDCAVANPGWTLQPFLGTGTGTFTKVGNAVPTGQFNSATNGVAEIGGARDLDGDGNVDLVLGEGPSLTILKGGGNGTFALAHVYAPSAVGAGLADVDSDGTPDVIALGRELLAVLHGRADGTFAAPEVHAEPDDRGGLSELSYDFDANGTQDIVIQTGAGIRAVLEGAGGTLTDAALLAETATAVDLKPGDVSGDGVGDLLGIFAASSGVTLRVARGLGDGTFAPFTTFAVPSVDVRSVQLADLNRDGKQDVVLVAYLDGGIWTALSNGDGTFTTPQRLLGASRWAVVVDVNGDGFKDVVSTNTHEVPVYLGDGAGGLVASYFLDVDDPYSAPRFTDVDRDGRLDIVTTGYDMTQGESITVKRGLPSGTFGPALVSSGITRDGFSVGALADVTGDGALDIIGRTFDAGFVVVPGYGDGYFYKQAMHYPAADFSSSALADNWLVNDVDQDGRTDILFWKGMGVGIAFNRGCVP